MKLNLNNLKPGSKVKLKEVFTDSFRPFKNGDGFGCGEGCGEGTFSGCDTRYN